MGCCGTAVAHAGTGMGCCGTRRVSRCQLSGKCSSGLLLPPSLFLSFRELRTPNTHSVNCSAFRETAHSVNCEPQVEDQSVDARRGMLRYPPTRSYAMSGTDLGYVDIRLRAPDVRY
eukprot:2131571-Rhodomonas_salina.1